MTHVVYTTARSTSTFSTPANMFLKPEERWLDDPQESLFDDYKEDVAYDRENATS